MAIFFILYPFIKVHPHVGMHPTRLAGIERQMKEKRNMPLQKFFPKGQNCGAAC
jgi:hypothetical protein